MEIRDDINSIESEEDSKVKIINRIFSECLGWPYQSFKCENKHDNGFSDYILSSMGEKSLIVEAKRVGVIKIISSVQDKYRTLKISGSSLKQCMNGIHQAFSYASECGIPVSVVTDGITWVVFKTWVVGSSYKDKEAFVFPSLEAIENSFSVFYELLAYEHVQNKTYNILFDEIHNSRMNLTLPTTPALEPSHIKIMKKSIISFDLEKVFNNFFSQLSGDENSEIMRECFVESNESRIADHSLEKITSSVLSNLSRDKHKVGSELSELIKGNLEAEKPLDSDLSVFIVGPTGSGKTTYIDRFFQKILPQDLRESCLTIKINCLEETGEESTVIKSITEKLIGFIELELFKGDMPKYDDLRGVYFNLYKRMSTGHLKKVYENDRASFDSKFADKLEEEIYSNREGYLESLLQFAINNRKKFPIIIVDNTDEFSLDFKSKVFQFCNAYRRKVKLCMLIFPVTDKSAWSFAKTDIFTIHQSRSFFLPTPSPKEVFRKRINYLNSKLNIEDIVQRKQYLSEKGIRIDLKDISNFARVLEDVFVENNYTAKTLGNLTNYNIRSIMQLSKRIITSPVLRIEDLITSYLTSEHISYNKFIDALIRGEYEAYKLTTGDDFGVISIFEVCSNKAHSPLLNLRIIALLKATKAAGKNIDERHLTVGSITQYFEAIGVDTIAIESCLNELLSLKLVEPYDPSESALSNSQKIAITYKGTTHYDLATRNNIYFYQMALTTRITDTELANIIRSTYNSKIPFAEKTFNIRKKFSDYLVNEDHKYIKIGRSRDLYSCQEELLKSIQAFSVSRNSTLPIDKDALSELIGVEVIGKVERYDQDNDYGFMSFDELEDDVYFKFERLEDFSIDRVYEGDYVYCTLKRGDKGAEIKAITGLNVEKTSFTTETCTIKVYYPDRGYGFATLGETSNEAFFHRTSFPSDMYEEIKLSLVFEAEVKSKDDGKFQVRRYVSLK